jgi:hypothetical protein
VCTALRRDLEAPLAAEVDWLLFEAGVPKRRQARAPTAIMRARLGSRFTCACWLLRLPPGASFWQQARQVHLLATWSQGRLAIGTGALLKQHLLAGALRLEPEEIRHQGAAQLLGRVFEAEAVEALALSGSFLGLVAANEILIVAAVTNLGAGAGRTPSCSSSGWLWPFFSAGGTTGSATTGPQAG